MKSMRKQLLGVVLLTLLALCGCKAPQQFGGVPRDKAYKAIISLSPSTTELLALFGVPLKGRSEACNYPVQVKSIPVMGSLKPDYEAINRFKPDLIVIDRDLYGDNEVKQLEATGGDVFRFGADSVDEFVKQLYVIGNKVGGEPSIMDYVEKINKQKRSSEGDPLAKPTRVVMLIPDASGHHMIAGGKSFQADLVRIMGGLPVGPDSNKFEALDAEYLVAQNPDVIMIAGDYRVFLKDTRFANLEAVKKLKIVGLDQDMLLRRGSRVDSCIYQGHKVLSLAVAGNK